MEQETIKTGSSSNLAGDPNKSSSNPAGDSNKSSSNLAGDSNKSSSNLAGDSNKSSSNPETESPSNPETESSSNSETKSSSNPETKSSSVPSICEVNKKKALGFRPQLQSNLNLKNYNFLSQRFDTIFDQIERSKIGMKTFSCIPLIGSLFQIGQTAIDTGARMTKNLEVSYILMACLGFISNVNIDLIKMNLFYNYFSIDEKPLYSAPLSLTNTLLHTYKFLFYALNTINFETEPDFYGNMGEKFIYGFISLFDFDGTIYDDNYVEIQTNSTYFRYSTPSCKTFFNIACHLLSSSSPLFLDYI
jgi:hypothetical protein